MNKLLKGAMRLGLHGTGLYGRGVRNARDVRLIEIELAFPGLPAAFDGYRLLHLSDLHVGLLPAGTERAIEIAATTPCDLCVMTGDYRPRDGADPDAVLPTMRRLAAAVTAPDGILAVLGNHDHRRLARTLPPLGIEVLSHRATAIRRQGEALHVLGVQDRHFRVQPAGRAALRRAPEGFVIALVHSPRYAALAAKAGIDLYLCGHTHGGQVCLPGGWPVYLPRGISRRRLAGGWRIGAMMGYTSRGTGPSGLPVRFNCPAEVVRFTLRRDTGNG